MCGISALLCAPGYDAARSAAARADVVRSMRLLRHRGPDWSGIRVMGRAVLGHERLAIVDPGSGDQVSACARSRVVVATAHDSRRQPICSADGRAMLAANGEIYNHRSLRAESAELRGVEWQTGSDCEVLLHLVRRALPPAAKVASADAAPPADPASVADGAARERLAAVCATLHAVNGMFAFCLYDAGRDALVAARDHMGIIPLYWGRRADGSLAFASEMKALVGTVDHVAEFPPGCVYHSDVGLARWYQPRWLSSAPATSAHAPDLATLRRLLETAVRRRMMSDVPWGVLLSGGLDSSLVAAIASRFAATRVEDDDRSAAWWPRLHTFSIGLRGSPDLAAARNVAAFLGTAHHEILFTVQEGLDALRDVVYHVRACWPQLARLRRSPSPHGRCATRRPRRTT